MPVTRWLPAVALSPSSTLLRCSGEEPASCRTSAGDDTMPGTSALGVAIPGAGAAVTASTPFRRLARHLH